MFFNKSDAGKRVALENTVLRERCQTILEKASNANDITDEVIENLHQVFLLSFIILHVV